MSKSKIITAMLALAQDLDIDMVTIKELEALDLKVIEPLKPSQIKKMRLREKLSQAVMARILNVTPSTYQKWERGDITPKGANLKLLRLANDHGVGYIV
jgi:putative transcriptional regulator